MWQRLGLSLAECRVYAYIYGLTTSTKAKQKGYKGSERALAKMLGLSRTSVNDTLRLLQQKNLIACDNDVYHSVNSADTDVNSWVTGSKYFWVVPPRVVKEENLSP